MPDPLHPALVHFPIVLALLSPVIAGTLLWAIHAKKLPATAWLGVVLLQLCVAGSGWLSAEAGEEEEERVERFVLEAPLEEHEEAAERFVWIAGLLIPLAAAGLLPGALGGGARAALTIASLGAAIAVGQVGHTGGELVYRHGAASARLERGVEAIGERAEDR